MDIDAFYGTLAGLSFTLLGLWWVACQTRMDWLADRGGRGMAYVVSLQFALPGAMSLLSLVAPDQPGLWRVTFATAGLVGFAGSALLMTTLRRRAAEAGLMAALGWASVPVYGLVALVAAVPGLSAATGLSALQIEAIALTVLLLLGTQTAWLLTFASGARN